MIYFSKKSRPVLEPSLPNGVISKPNSKPAPRPSASGPTHGTLPAGFKAPPPPAPKPNIMESKIPSVGEVAPAYATISSTKYTGNRYYATRKRLSYHPQDKQFTGTKLSTITYAPSPHPQPSPAPTGVSQTRGTLPAGISMTSGSKRKIKSATRLATPEEGLGAAPTGGKQSMQRSKSIDSEKYIPSEWKGDLLKYSSPISYSINDIRYEEDRRDVRPPVDPQVEFSIEENKDGIVTYDQMSHDNQYVQLDEFSFERYPYTTFPDKVPLEKTVPLEVIIKGKPFEGQQTIIKIIANKGEKEVKILAIAKAEPKDAFEFIGRYYKEIIVPVDQIDSKPVKFKLKAKKLGLCTIKIGFIQNGTYLGEINTKTKIVKSVEKIAPASPVTATTKYPLDTSTVAPDLSLLIIETGGKKNFKYEVILESIAANIPYTRVGPIKFKGDPETKFRATFEEIENTHASPEVIEENLMAKGRSLYDELFSSKLKEIYWNIHNKIKSIRIISEEPWIPWEIIKPWRRVNGKSEEDGFLCEQYSFSRWLEGQRFQKKNQLIKIKLVVPYDTNLQGAQVEADWIIKFAESIKFDVSIDSSYEQVMSSLKNDDFDLLHFSTHGKYNKINPNMSQLFLENKLILKPENITGLATNFGQSHPVIILNACQTGEQGFSLTGIGSWAKQFLEAEASAFIGTLWSVNDSTALRFTQMFYQKIANGVSLDDAVKESRNLARQRGDPSWLAYTLYAQPNSKIKLGANY